MKTKFKVKDFFVPLLIGILFIAAIVGIVCCVMIKNDISVSSLSYILNAIIVLGCVLAAFLAGKRVRLKGIISGAVTGLILAVIVYGLLFFINGFIFSGITVISLCVSPLLGAISGIVAGNLR